MTIVGVLPKASDAILNYTIDWSEQLGEDDTIVDSVWSGETGITATTDGYDDTTTTVNVTGGTTGYKYIVTNHVTLASGLEDTREILVQVGIRSGMTHLVLELRGLTDTEEGQTSINGVTYWTDQHLQEILDQFGRDINTVQLNANPEQVDGTTTWTKYYFPDALGTKIETGNGLQIVNSTGYTQEDYTIDLSARRVTFDEDTNGVEYYMRGRVYDMNGAASKVWLMKAGHRSQLINWKAGSHTLAEDQEYQHCLDMWKHYGSVEGLKNTRLMKEGYQTWATR